MTPSSLWLISKWSKSSRTFLNGEAVTPTPLYATFWCYYRSYFKHNMKQVKDQIGTYCVCLVMLLDLVLDNNQSTLRIILRNAQQTCAIDGFVSRNKMASSQTKSLYSSGRICARHNGFLEYSSIPPMNDNETWRNALLLVEISKGANAP